MTFDNSLIIVKTPTNKYLSVVQNKKEFITSEGVINYIDIKKIPCEIYSSTGVKFKIYKPSYKEFTTLMKRGPQIIYPKDAAQIILEADIRTDSQVLEIGTGSGALTLYLYLILKNEGKLFTLDSSSVNQRRANKTIRRFLSTLTTDENVNVNFLTNDLLHFKLSELDSKVDTIITDVPEPWEFFTHNQIDFSLSWVSYLPSITQAIKIKECLEKENFENIEVKEVLIRDWIINKKIVRPSHSQISHTGFIISGKYYKY